ncbi:MarR family transcriptional regulator [Thalassotalea marina]|uniref:HTH-type transcriptional regulator SarZ n=2 Tax=Thalassotalea marina TaxID=1673741 RepID=A0A919EKF8_9GAMM|nr:MarR family transcriptional regulator [Thalassotalea marina]
MLIVYMSDSLKLENQLCHRFYLLSNAFTRAYRPLLDELDITYPQYLVLMALWEVGETTIASVTDKTGIDAGAMTQILKKLVSKGIVGIRKDEQDKRVKNVYLTADGQGLKKSATSIPSQMLCKFNGLDPSELKQLVSLLDRLNTCFKNVDDNKS